jgi:hypothetical protein
MAIPSTVATAKKIGHRPAIPAVAKEKKDVDARDKRGHDVETFALRY